MSSNVFKTISVFMFLLAFAVILALILGLVYSGSSGNVAVIPITGQISTQESLFESTASSSSIVSFIEDAAANPDVQAILFEIDSPGGTIVATREISNAIKQVEKPTVCWMRETAASGAYYIASNCDVIVADPYTITGSIGVIGSYLEFSDLFEEYGINYVRIVSGEKKDLGSPFREPTKDEIKELQVIVNEINQDFLGEVKENRNLTDAEVETLSDARILLGKDAFNLGLVDVLGSKNEAEQAIKDMSNITDIQYLYYQQEFSFSELAAGFFGKSMTERYFENDMDIKV